MDLNRNALILSTTVTSHVLSDIQNFGMSSSESSDSDFEIEQILRIAVPRISISSYFDEVVPSYSRAEFIWHFGIPPDLFIQLSDEYEKTAEYQQMVKFNPSRVLGSQKTIAIFLWFAAHEACSFRDISDRFNVSTSTVHVAIIRIVVFLSNMSSRVIRWPTLVEMRAEAVLREAESRIPGIIGCVGSTRIVIDPPAADKDSYIDRKGDVSLIIQAVCSKKKKFIDCFIGYPGSVHDSQVFKNSQLPEKLLQLPIGHRILGDSAYPCQEHLLAPYRDNGQLTPAQKNLNTAINNQRIDVEHTFGILKKRFRQLYYCKLRGNKLLCNFFRACLVLHNLADVQDIDFIFENELPDNIDQPEPEVEVNANGDAFRDAACLHVFDNN